MNKQEQDIFEYFEKFHRGHTKFKIYRNGWPDFLVVKKEGYDDRPRISLFCIEVKSNGQEPTANQKVVHEALRSVGIPTHVVRTLHQAVHLRTGRLIVNPSSITELKEEIRFLETRLDDLLDKVKGYHPQIEELKSLLDAIIDYKDVLFPTKE